MANVNHESCGVREDHTREVLCFDKGELLYEAGETGPAFRVMAGSVRLDTVRENGGREKAPDGELDGAECFAGLAVSGDLIGAEGQLYGVYTYEARALAPCIVQVWSAASQPQNGLDWLRALAQIEKRYASTIALRHGEARARVGRLLLLLAGSSTIQQDNAQVVLPSLRDMADITSLTIETVSRTLSRLRAARVIHAQGKNRLYRLVLGRLAMPE